MVQATVAAHISAICAGALRHRESIIETAATATSDLLAGSSALAPRHVDTISMPTTPSTMAAAEVDGYPVIGHVDAAPGSKDIAGGPSGGGSSSGGGGGGGGAGCGGRTVGRDADTGGHAHERGREEGADEFDVEGTREGQGETRHQTNQRDPDTEAAVATAVAPSGVTMPTAADPGSVSAGGDPGNNDDWWEEDEEEQDDRDGQPRPGGVAGASALWRGKAGRSDAATAPRREGCEVQSESSRWIRRREREIPFLRLLVGSQVRVLLPVISPLGRPVNLRTCRSRVATSNTLFSSFAPNRAFLQHMNIPQIFGSPLPLCGRI